MPFQNLQSIEWLPHAAYLTGSRFTPNVMGAECPMSKTSVSDRVLYPNFLSPHVIHLVCPIILDWIHFWACGIGVLMNIRTYTLVDSGCIPWQLVDYPHVYTLMQHHGRHIANNSLYVQIISKSQTISCIVTWDPLSAR